MMSHINRLWLRILLFYLIAVQFSFAFRFLQLSAPGGQWVGSDYLAAAGVFVGAVFVTRLFHVPRQISFFGSYAKQSLCMAGMAIAFYVVVGANTGGFWQRHGTSLWLGLWIIFYGVLEETGWRGYLQDELRGLHFALRYTLIGMLWYAWHLNFLRDGISPIGLLFSIASSFGIGFAVEHTRSVLVAACFHSLGNLLVFSTLLQANMSRTSRWGLAGLCCAAWVLVLVLWKPTPAPQPASERRTEPAARETTVLE